MNDFFAFIAGPSDVNKEKEEVEKAIGKLNLNFGEQLGFTLKAKRFENDVIPGFGSDPQAITNEQVVKKCNILILVMHSRFGTPTDRSASGSYEEYQIFIDRFRKEEDVDILIYFKTEKVDIDCDTDQLKMVQSFKEEINKSGGFFSSFSKKDEFVAKFEKDISKLIVDRVKKQKQKQNDYDRKIQVTTLLSDRLNGALKTFNDQPIIWIDPIISKTNEISSNPSDNYNNLVELDSLLVDDTSFVISAASQFGLSCIGRKLAIDGWKRGRVYAFLDMDHVKRSAIEKSIRKYIEEIGLKGKEADGIILDNWNREGFGHNKILKDLIENYGNKKLMVLEKVDQNKLINDYDEISFIDNFNHYYVLGLPKHEMRKIVKEYNRLRLIGDEDVVLEKLSSDIEALNIHRTPLNCITLLKVSEKFFDVNPVNRSRMLELVLVILFDLEYVPTYSTKPDVKDVEHILGYFCEMLIRENRYTFSKTEFKAKTENFCKEQLINLDVEIVLSTLYSNRILSIVDDELYFNFTYWLYFFAAKRMHVSEAFRHYMFEGKRYVRFPEIIEFYTGIDRNKNDLLNLILNDIRETIDKVDSNLGLPEDFKPFDGIMWTSSPEQISNLRETFEKDVSESKFPDEIKDKYSDLTYDQVRPYNQNISDFIERYDLGSLIRKASVGARALRNSDYAEPKIKIELFKMIIASWVRLANVLFVISPILAEKKTIIMHGVKFTLSDNFEGSTRDKIMNIIPMIPFNMLIMMKNDVLSSKMGPLLYQEVEDNKNDLLSRHLVSLLITTQLTEGFKKPLSKYINSVDWNSYYLADLIRYFQTVYQFSNAKAPDLKNLQYLIKYGVAKHHFKRKEVKNVDVMKISNSVIPKLDKDEQKGRSLQ